MTETSRSCFYAMQNIFVTSDFLPYATQALNIAHDLAQRASASLIERFKIMSHYYGFVPTAFRHIGFCFRALRKKFKNNKK